MQSETFMNNDDNSDGTYQLESSEIYSECRVTYVTVLNTYDCLFPKEFVSMDFHEENNSILMI